jgi:glycosyltransferase involved in cell wall biosynthesis
MPIPDKQLDFILLIPCYNDFEGLILSLKSVSYNPDRFQVVVVDDGSPDPVTENAIKSGTNIDCPIIVLRNETNEGITSALNKGLQWIESNGNAKYIGRLDCGDICDPNRFVRQVEYMDTYSDTTLLGSWCIFQTKDASLNYLYKTPVDHERIKRAMHIRNVFIHPTVIFRATALQKISSYPARFQYAEDYAFFWELIKLGRSHILNEFLVICAIDNKGISLKNRHKQLDTRAKIIAKYGTNLLLKIAGILRVKVLHIVPKQLALRLKKLTTL